MNRITKILVIIVLIVVPLILVGYIVLIELNDPRDYRQDMRTFVQNLSSYAKGIDSNFIVIPQNGQELLTENGEGTGTPVTSYLSAIDGVGREDLFYGYNNDNEATPSAERDYLIEFLDLAENNGIEVLVTDYCWTPALVDSSYSQNTAKGYISFAADHRDLDSIPPYPTLPYNNNSDNILSLGNAKNFLYLLNPSSFPNKSAFLNAIITTDYDLIIMDLFYEDIQLNATEILSLKTKIHGGTRLIIAYMSIGEAEDYRYYWQSEWAINPPSWLAAENPSWPGNYKVRYWDSSWQEIIYGTDNSYLKRIVDAGFDGVYLDIIDAFEYFET